MQKLVRDLIPEIIRKKGLTPVVRTIEQKEWVPLLLKKLDEELAELRASMAIEEIADVMEVLFALSRELGTPADELLSVMMRKRAERGGFENGVFLEEILDKPESALA